MGKDLNRVMLTGRLGADPEMRFTPQGSAVTTFRVASNRTWKTAGGEQKEETEWFSVVCWNKLAEICNQYLTKGSRVYIEGRAQTRSWEDATSGQTRYKTEVVASEMIMLDGASGGSYSAAAEDGPLGDYEDAPAAPAAPARRPAPNVQQPAARPAAPTNRQQAPQSNAQPPRSARRPFVQPADQKTPLGDDLPF